ncbi:hypothetical protein ACFQ4M_17020 [Thauera mechernichensis]|uniref:Uncharacterized protein n=1 Tax=Thauera mechernichensis TaxID=82788 RepID=A0ABW3WHL1_9RHOO|nr:hypothetical protein [Thauera mechernichensis]MDG3066055.1 hypothetical protein [Thauera mechernichensis]
MSSNNGVANLLSNIREREAAKAEQMKIAAQIAAVPDSQFDDHPEVKRHRERVALLERRSELTEDPSQRRRLAEAIAAMRLELVERSADVTNAAIDDLADDPITFRRAFAATEEARRLTCVITAAEAALGDLNRKFNGRSPQLDQLRAARSELDRLLRRLKREHLGISGK